MHPRGWRLYLLFGSLASVPIVAIPDSWWYTAWYDTIGLSALAAVLLSARGRHAGAHRSWWWLAAGQLLFVVGDYLFDLNERVWHTGAFPSVADGFYLCGYLPLAVGLLLLIRARTPGRDRPSLIDAAIIAVGFGLLAWLFLLKPAASDGGLSLLGRFIASAYPAADLLLLALLARLLVGAGARNTAFRLLAGSLVCLLAADVGYAVLNQTGSFTPHQVVNVAWLWSYVLFGAAALHPAMATLSERAAEPPPQPSLRRLPLLTAVSLVAPTLLLLQTWAHAHVDTAAIGAGAVALALLVVARMAGLVRQVEQQAVQLDRLAQHDPLTGVANRRAWDQALVVELDRARRGGSPLALALLDLDHFKRFNDDYGHQAGDRLLKGATTVWQPLLRQTDLLARYGGEEFAVLLPGVSLDRAVEVLDRLRLATPLAQSFSAGVACWDGRETSDQLLGRADHALYQAKQAGRNQVLPAGSAASPGRRQPDPAATAAAPQGG